jgi:hypothetical protein
MGHHFPRLAHDFNQGQEIVVARVNGTVEQALREDPA